MELKFGSVMLLLSCSLQQSLWGILASVPQTSAKQCKHKISSDGEPVKKVQMIRRIPARCSGWDEAWSWISKKDCRTKYILDYVELPSAVQKVDSDDCEEETPSPSTTENLMTDEKFMAIAFGSATVALIILIIIIVISVCRRGHYRCTSCGTGPTYSSANGVDRDEAVDVRVQGNQYGDEQYKKGDPVYEEIFDRSKRKQLDDSDMPRYENAPENDDDKGKLSNGVRQTRPITPSAPSEEEFHNVGRKTAVPNEYGVLRDNHVMRSSEPNKVSEDDCQTAGNFAEGYDDQWKKISSNQQHQQDTKDHVSPDLKRTSVIDNTYSEFNDLIPVQRSVSNEKETDNNINSVAYTEPTTIKDISLIGVATVTQSSDDVPSMSLSSHPENCDGDREEQPRDNLSNSPEIDVPLVDSSAILLNEMNSEQKNLSDKYCST